MRAGALNEIIEIQRSIVNKDVYGDDATTWETAIKTRASVTYRNGNRGIENHEVVNTYTVEFMIRIYHDVNERMRICWNGGKYRILAINRRRDKQFTLIIGELINE